MRRLHPAIKSLQIFSEVCFNSAYKTKLKFATKLPLNSEYNVTITKTQSKISYAKHRYSTSSMHILSSG